ncbi:MAG TPA: hypothetical protein PLD76_03690, partial [Paludibacteraceae bacterium]|nr:hypothetical protein [Paludibacteraceae bacterium]
SDLIMYFSRSLIDFKIIGNPNFDKIKKTIPKAMVIQITNPDSGRNKSIRLFIKFKGIYSGTLLK